jgi:hypothetical protein
MHFLGAAQGQLEQHRIGIRRVTGHVVPVSCRPSYVYPEGPGHLLHLCGLIWKNPIWPAPCPNGATSKQRAMLPWSDMATPAPTTMLSGATTTCISTPRVVIDEIFR